MFRETGVAAHKKMMMIVMTKMKVTTPPDCIDGDEVDDDH